MRALGIKKLKIGIMEQLELFYSIFLDWNSRLNLSSLKGEDDTIEKHFLDSLLLGSHLTGKKGIDVGSGGGFPGLILAIANPENKFTLVESIGKKCKFLKFAKEKLKLTNVEVINGRAETLELSSNSNNDFATARAVASLAVTLEYVAPLLKIGGEYIAQKSSKFEEELELSKKSSNILGMEFKKIVKYILPSSGIERSLIIFEKSRETPNSYPRKVGMARKKPL